MRIREPSGLAVREISTAVLLGVALVAMTTPSDLALGQSSTGTVVSSPLFTAIDLTPGESAAEAWGIFPGQQVGGGGGPATGGSQHALLWRGSPTSLVDLSPKLFDVSEAHGICGGQQVGWGIPAGHGSGGPRHALLWRGSAASAVDLTPRGFDTAEIYATSGDQQVGYGSLPGTGSHRNEHALLWRGSAASVVDLHPRGFLYSWASGVSGGQQVGSGELPATELYRNVHALLWRGTAVSVVDLHPHGFLSSSASGASGGQQVGTGWIGDLSVAGQLGGYHALLWRGSAASVVDLSPTGSDSVATATNGEEQVGRVGGHAVVWRGSAASMVDLHGFLPPNFRFSAATAIDSNGDIVGYASDIESDLSHAFLWKRNAQRRSTSREQSPTGC